MQETKCWNCKKCDCCWVRRFEPVKGWKAEKTQVKSQHGQTQLIFDSFIVKSCPLFESAEKPKTKSTKSIIRLSAYEFKKMKKAARKGAQNEQKSKKKC